MKIKPYLSILLLAWFCPVHSQNLLMHCQIGSFNSAKSFSINPSGNIFIVDSASNEIIKLDTLGNIIKTIGGYGWQESSFDNAVDVFANSLNVYVSDKNNNRIQIFDKDLNFLSQISNEQVIDSKYTFGYPTCASLSSQGDLFILDSDNKRILKFNLRGEFQSSIGGYDAGSFSFSNPKAFTITIDSKILVVDFSSLLLFDQFGNGLQKIQLPFEPKNINSTFHNITVNDEYQIALISNLNVDAGIHNFVILDPKLSERIVDSFVFNSKLYILTGTTIMIYQIIN